MTNSHKNPSKATAYASRSTENKPGQTGSEVSYIPVQTNLSIPTYSSSDYFEKYTVVGFLGRGSEGVVLKVKDKKTNSDYALNILNETVNGKTNWKRANEKIEATAKYGESVMQVKGIVDSEEPHTIQYTVQGVQKNVKVNKAFMTEVAEGTLYHHLKHADPQKNTINPYTLDERMYLFSQLVFKVGDNLQKIHADGNLHCDVKLGNIYVVKKDGFELVLGDYGFVLPVDGFKQDKNAFRGTQKYAAPEMLDRDEITPITPGTDIYSLGVIAYEILTNQDPFKDLRDKKGKALASAKIRFASGTDFDGIYNALKKDNPSLDDKLAEIVEKIMYPYTVQPMGKKDKIRYTSMSEVQKDVREYLGQYTTDKIKEGYTKLAEQSQQILKGSVAEIDNTKYIKQLKNIHAFLGISEKAKGELETLVKKFEDVQKIAQKIPAMYANRRQTQDKIRNYYTQLESSEQSKDRAEKHWKTESRLNELRNLLNTSIQTVQKKTYAEKKLLKLEMERLEGIVEKNRLQQSDRLSPKQEEQLKKKIKEEDRLLDRYNSVIDGYENLLISHANKK